MDEIPVVNKEGNIVAVATLEGILSCRKYPLSSRDKEGYLRVGATIKVPQHVGKRVDMLVSVGVDVVQIFCLNADSEEVIKSIKSIKKKHPSLQVMAGNIVTVRQAKRLAEAGADALVVGMGVGSLSVAQNVWGLGRGQATALYNVARLCKTLFSGLPVVADGAIKSTGDIVKALALGGSSVMIGRLFAGATESPGEVIKVKGFPMKRYIGKIIPKNREVDLYLSEMDQISFCKSTCNTRVLKGDSVERVFSEMVLGLRFGMLQLGCRKVTEHVQSRVELRTEGSQREGEVGYDDYYTACL